MPLQDFSPNPFRCLIVPILAMAAWVMHGSVLANDVFAEPTPAERAAINGDKAAAGESAEQPGWNLATLESIATDRSLGPLDLIEAWRLTVLNDPDYQAAISARGAAETERRQGRAALLPQVQAGHSRSRITGEQTQYAPLGSRRAELDYDSTSTYVQLQQPLFNIERYADYRRGVARAELGVAEFHEREQEVALRLASVYLNVLGADSQWILTKQLADSLEAQATAQDRLFESNEGSRVDAQETRARLALARAEVIRAHDARQVALRELEAMVGRPVEAVAPLANVFRPQRLQPASLAEWMSLARSTNPAVRVAREAVKVAQAELQRATGRYMPSLDLVAAYSKADSENLSSLSQRTNTWTVGVQANVPLFSGGYNSANRARASALLAQAREELRAAEEAAEAEVARQHAGVVGGVERIDALMAAVDSSQQNLEAAEASYKYGVRSNVDILRARDRLYDARTRLTEAHLDYMAAWVGLHAATGQLNELVLGELSRSQLSRP